MGQNEKSKAVDRQKCSADLQYRMCLTLGVTAGCLFLPLVRSIDEWTRWGKKEEPI